MIWDAGGKSPDIRFGLAIMNDFPPGTVPADRVRELREQVVAARDTGFSSIWMLQHYLGNMPTLQPLPTLAAVSGEAGDMSVGTNMFILPLHHPVEVAESFATLDHLTGGRVIAGFGLGYRQNEFDAFGISLDNRLGRYEEAITILRGLWAGDEVTFKGEHFAIDGQRISLLPVQPGGPRIWVGAGAHRTGAARAARLGDGWVIPPHVPLPRLKKVLSHYREVQRGDTERDRHAVIRRELLLDYDAGRARDRGLAARGALTRQYGAFNAPDSTTYRHLEGNAAATEVADESYLFATPDHAAEKLRELQGAGITDVILRMQWYDLPHADVLRTMELFKSEVLPQLS